MVTQHLWIEGNKIHPFKLLFGEEAILPEELSHKSPRVTFAKDETNTLDEEQLTKDLAEELKCQAVNNLHSYQAEIVRWWDKKVNPHQINTRDMVLIRKQNAKMADKLQPKWVGPYLATQANRLGAYNLQDSDSNQLPHTWNIDDLWKYYP